MALRNYQADPGQPAGPWGKARLTEADGSATPVASPAHHLFDRLAASARTYPATEGDVAKWPRGQRVIFILGSSALLWTGIGFAVSALVA